MSSGTGQPSEEELRAAYEAELKRLRVEHVLLDNVVALVNLGMRRTGLAPGTEGERDTAQVRLAIESIRALLPVLEEAAPSQVGAIRDAVSQLQMAFVRIGGQTAAGEGEGSGGGGGPGSGGSGGPGPGGPGESGSGGPGGPGSGGPGGPGGPGSGGPGGPGSGGPGGPGGPGPGGPGAEGPGPAQRSGRLWVPGQ